MVAITQREELRLSLCMCADAAVAARRHFRWSRSLAKTDVTLLVVSYAVRNVPNLSCIKADVSLHFYTHSSLN